MVFSSLLFLFVFLPIFFCIYLLAPKFLKNLTLFLASLIFYAWGEPIYFTLMIFTTFLDFSVGRAIDFYRNHKYIPKLALITSIVLNLSMLGFFKYSDFFISNLNVLLNTNFATLNLSLPIGISFYTFQTMSYTIDVYRNNTKVQKNIISFGAYVVMFPQLIAGPIVTYATVENQMDNRKVTLDRFGQGVFRLIEGLGKKVLIANNIGLLWETTKNTSFNELSVFGAWLGILAFALQIYFDFSGYSDMAIGLGDMLGFKFPENFNYPYMSKSITEFWRRWHITLGTWFRDYLYIPLGGNRVGKARMYFNITLVWFLTGFWHGAGWNFILWGLYFALIIIAEKAFLLKFLENIKPIVARIYFTLLILISWTFFAFDDLAKGIDYLKIMLGLGNVALMNNATLYEISNYFMFIIIGLLCSTPLIKKLKCKLSSEIIFILYILILIICTAYLVDSTFNPFLYFRF